MATPSRPELPSWRCPHCGPLAPAQVDPYDEDLRRRCFPGFDVAPVAMASAAMSARVSGDPIDWPAAPACGLCGATLAAPPGPVRSPGRRVLVLTGTCGSGKSAVAARLKVRYGYGVIDGDQVIGWIKDRYGPEQAAYDGPGVTRVIGCQLDCLLALGRDVVLAHVVLPEHLPRYRALLRHRGVAFRFVVLQPELEVALARTRARTCFGGVTPPEIVVAFCRACAAMGPSVGPDVVVMDSSSGTPDELADRIMGLEAG